MVWTPGDCSMCDRSTFHLFQNSSPAVTSPSSAAPVTGYKRMVIPTQPPLTATKKSTPKAQASPAPPASGSPVAKPQFQTAAAPQPVPASYTTASTPSQPTFNVQVRAAQPGPQHPPAQQQQYGQPMPPQQQPMRGPVPVQYMPAQPRGPDFAYGPPQPGFMPAAAPQPSYADYPYGGGGQNTWRGEPQGQAIYQPPTPKKTYITEPPPSLTPYSTGPPVPLKVRRGREGTHAVGGGTLDPLHDVAVGVFFIRYQLLPWY